LIIPNDLKLKTNSQFKLLLEERNEINNNNDKSLAVIDNMNSSKKWHRDDEYSLKKAEILDRFSIDIIHAEKHVKDSDSIIMNKKLVQIFNLITQTYDFYIFISKDP
jgi:hypothetical protein